NKTKFLATHDELTGLANRYLLYDRIQQLLSDIERNHGSAAMLMIDLNDFKKINDTLGHDIGDLLLKEVSKRLTSTLRAIDTVARLGGDEFVVVTPHVSVAGIKLVVQKIIHLLPYPIFIANNEMKIGVSIGITLIPSEGKDTKTLLKNCDIAMYRAKKMGRNNYQFFSGELSNEVTVLNPKTLD
ncbi:MAG TPA: GGDEF domain-containing protein, partial [Nitrosomonas sp.]|nr:GGDEF domain-containing protein [Nitrosomonas sp.]